MAAPPPRSEHARREALRLASAHAAAGRALLLARLIGALALAWMVLAYQSCDRHRFTSLWLLCPTAALIALAALRGRVLARQRDALRAARFHAEALARIDERWTDAAGGGERFRDDAHPFAGDLDLFGKGSLYGLLCTARTPIGQQTLASWLVTPAPREVVLARQRAVAELAAQLDLREALATRGDALFEDDVQERSLLAWAEQERAPVPGSLRVLAAAMGLLTTAAVGALSMGHVLPALAVFVAAVAFARRCARRTVGIEQGLAQRTRELQLLAALVAVVENTAFTAPALVALRAELTAGSGRASAEIARLARLVGWYETRRNAMQALLTAPLLLSTQLAMAVQNWQARNGAAVARWVRAAGAIEALSSLAAFAHEHPDFPFPELLDQSDGPHIEGEAVGHPLIASARRVLNPVALGKVHLLLISGSNMSGKSTYLRTVGVNVVLALAGAPVCARRFALTPVTLAATLRVNDSLQAGHSRFYAEITRLKHAVAEAQRSPFTLALLDEILHGTNSHDRLIGARGIVKALIDAGALAIVTTHDLALAHLVDDLGERADNVHFQDRIEDGKLVFDYTMRAGTITRTNALDLMRLVGLDV